MSSEDKCEPVAYQFQDRDGVWRPFVDQRHYENTLKDGTWPIRPLYSTRGPDAVLVPSKKLTEMQARIVELERQLAESRDFAISEAAKIRAEYESQQAVLIEDLCQIEHSMNQAKVLCIELPPAKKGGE